MSEKLQAALAPTVAGLGCTLLGIDLGRASEGLLVRLYIDKPDGVTVSDCETVSRQVSDILEVEQLIRGEYTLEVSSPGLDRPLFTLAQHRDYIGAQVHVRLRSLVEGRRRLKGALEAVTDNEIVLRSEGQVYTIPFQDIDKSRLIPEFEFESGQRGSWAGRGENAE